MVTYTSALGLIRQLATLTVEKGFYAKLLTRIESDPTWDRTFRAYLKKKRFVSHLDFTEAVLFDFPDA